MTAAEPPSAMLGIFRQFRARRTAIRAADEITLPLLRGLTLFSPAGELDKKMRTDEFLLSYMYGIFLCGIDARGITDDMQKGFTLWECYDRVFPGEGRQVLSLCNLRVEGGDERFNCGVREGYVAMSKFYKSEEPSPDTLSSLVKHLRRHYTSTWP